MIILWEAFIFTKGKLLLFLKYKEKCVKPCDCTNIKMINRSEGCILRQMSEIQLENTEEIVK